MSDVTVNSNDPNAAMTALIVVGALALGLLVGFPVAWHEATHRGPSHHSYAPREQAAYDEGHYACSNDGGARGISDADLPTFLSLYEGSAWTGASDAEQSAMLQGCKDGRP